MDDLVDMIISDESPSNISDAVKGILFNKTVEKIEQLRPSVSSSMFDQQFNSEDE